MPCGCQCATGPVRRPTTLSVSQHRVKVEFTEFTLKQTMIELVRVVGSQGCKRPYRAAVLAEVCLATNVNRASLPVVRPGESGRLIPVAPRWAISFGQIHVF
jgi:hypothetical protein